MRENFNSFDGSYFAKVSRFVLGFTKVLLIKRGKKIFGIIFKLLVYNIEPSSFLFRFRMMKMMMRGFLAPLLGVRMTNRMLVSMLNLRPPQRQAKLMFSWLFLRIAYMNIILPLEILKKK